MSQLLNFDEVTWVTLAFTVKGPSASRTSNTSKRPFVTSCKYFFVCWRTGLFFNMEVRIIFFCFFYQSIKDHCHLEPRTPGKGHLWPLASIFLYAGGLICFSLWRWDLCFCLFFQYIKSHCHLELWTIGKAICDLLCISFVCRRAALFLVVEGGFFRGRGRF